MQPPDRPDANDSQHDGTSRRRLGRRAGVLTGAVAAAWTLGLLGNRALRAVDGPSMLPTLAPDDHLLTVPSSFVAPRRGDVVVLAPGTVGPTASVKRLVGLPGEHVVVLDGHLYVDGTWWDLPAGTLVDSDHEWHTADREAVVLGDNQPRSTDSRSTGTVPLEAIERIALARCAPWQWLRPPRGLRRAPGPRRRDAVRIVVLDPRDRVLLFRVADLDGRHPDWWETPGGGLHPGEDALAAARRELAEEVGHRDVAIVPLDHVAERDSVLRGAPLRRVETTMAARLDDDTVSTEGWTASERRDHVDWRWFTRSELDRLDAVTHPADLATLVDRATVTV